MLSLETDVGHMSIWYGALVVASRLSSLVLLFCRNHDLITLLIQDSFADLMPVLPTSCHLHVAGTLSA